MGKIKVLSQELINMIAAGEVVERPSSVVKELIENSVDAQSTEIFVYIENSGEDLIHIKDNGVGMNQDDAKMALVQHATSKIKDKTDLENILTLGFRGEALASISSVSEKTIILTKAENADGVRVEAVSKNISVNQLNLSTCGTEVKIYGLFNNIPARKKFLKSPNTELKHIINTFIEVALPYTNIHFELYHNSKLIYRLTKTSDIKTRIYEIWGKKVAQDFLNIELQDSDIHGLLQIPETAQQKAPIQFSFINNRYIKSNLINAAVRQAYNGYIHRDLKPNFILFLKLNPKEVDINVHPRKLEAKFSNDQFIFNKVHSFTKYALEKHTKAKLANAFKKDEDRVTDPTFLQEQNQKPYQTNSNNQKINHTFTTNTFKGTRIKEAMSFTRQLFALNDLGLGNAPETPTDFIGYKPFQVFSTYICFENEKNELIFIDQHAAAEKITFEKLIKTVNNPSTKPLLVPEIINFKSTADKNEIVLKIDELAKIGIIISEFTDKSVQVTEIPEILTTLNIQDTVNDILTDNPEILSTYNSKYKVSKELYLFIASAACHSSIRAGQKLEENEMLNIIKELLLLDEPGNCPHGRPTMWKISKTEMEKNFVRNL